MLILIKYYFRIFRFIFFFLTIIFLNIYVENSTICTCIRYSRHDKQQMAWKTGVLHKSQKLWRVDSTKEPSSDGRLQLFNLYRIDGENRKQVIIVQ